MESPPPRFLGVGEVDGLVDIIGWQTLWCRRDPELLVLEEVDLGLGGGCGVVVAVKFLVVMGGFLDEDPSIRLCWLCSGRLRSLLIDNPDRTSHLHLRSGSHTREGRVSHSGLELLSYFHIMLKYVNVN